ncbi:hypothetical protein QF049_001050 [Paenibacillus sp. W4I10]|uniref:hypothetical protein n=1 Tax=Paenibacillus sp. W4I10 TaxID=3042298 RepID=UPI002786CD5D|nr:hypothetical protein [Paenibacillus sp. W4I10]MDQ0719789.1 hypothetical protein [Paenibacillus sp. W4I10]
MDVLNNDTLHLDYSDFEEIERIKLQNPGTDYMYALNVRASVTIGSDATKFTRIETHDALKERYSKLIGVLEEALRTQ